MILGAEWTPASNKIGAIAGSAQWIFGRNERSAGEQVIGLNLFATPKARPARSAAA